MAWMIYRYKQIVKEIEFGKACYICTSRENQFATKFDYEIKLEPLTTEQTFLFINDYLGNHASNEYFVESIIKELDHQCLMPRLITGKIHDRLKMKDLVITFLISKETYTNCILIMTESLYNIRRSLCRNVKL